MKLTTKIKCHVFINPRSRLY